MTEDSNAAQVEENSFDLDQVGEIESNEITESAPVEDAKETEESEGEQQPELDNVQKRINKITAEKHEARREAEELRKRLEALESKPKEAAKKPELSEFDYDDDAYQAALVDYRVQKALEDRDLKLNQAEQARRAQEQQIVFNDRIEKLKKPDFWEVANAVPTLAPEVVNTLMEAEDGASLIYHLGTHLDQADKLASMSPNQALLEIGRMSASLNKKKTVKLSAAPEPIDPINSGGSLSKKIEDMSMEEIYRL